MIMVYIRIYYPNATVAVMTYPRYRRLSEANKRDYFIVVHHKSGKLTLRLSPNVETYT